MLEVPEVVIWLAPSILVLLLAGLKSVSSRADSHAMLLQDNMHDDDVRELVLEIDEVEDFLGFEPDQELMVLLGIEVRSLEAREE